MATNQTRPVFDEPTTPTPPPAGTGTVDTPIQGTTPARSDPAAAVEPLEVLDGGTAGRRDVPGGEARR
jgi:hypothetical protein